MNKLSFVDFIGTAIEKFSTKIKIRPLINMEDPKRESSEFHNLNRINYELHRDNQMLIDENNQLKDELDDKDILIDSLQDQLKTLGIALAECEIRLRHTTSMMTKEKEATTIAFNRILSGLTNDELNSAKFLKQNLLLTNLPNYLKMPKQVHPEAYQTLKPTYKISEEDIYSTADLYHGRRTSMSNINSSSLNLNQRTVHTNASNMITGPGETTSTGMMNNTVYNSHHM